MLNRDPLQPEYRADCYLYGHFMRFIVPRATRIASLNSADRPLNVAFQNPDGSLVLIAANRQSKPRELTVAWRDGIFTGTFASKSVAKLRWAK